MPDVIYTDPATGAQTTTWVSDEIIAAHPDSYQPLDATVVQEGTGEVFQISGDAVSIGALGRDETASERASRERTQVAEEIYGGAGQRALTAAEGALSGLTFGVVDPLLVDEDTRNRARVNPGTRTAGEIGGALIPSVLSGGSGTVGQLARLTPRGAVTAGLERWAGSSLGRRIAAEAAEGTLDAAGQLAARSALSDEPLSGESVLTALASGAALGGGAGALFQGLSKAGRRVLGDSVGDARLGRLADPDDAAALADDLAGKGAVAARKAEVDLDKLIPKADRQAAGEYYGRVLRVGDESDLASQAAAREIGALRRERAFDALPMAQADQLRAELDTALASHRAATKDIRKWAQSVSKKTSVDDLREGRIPDELGTVSDDAFANLVKARSVLEDILERTRVATGRKPSPDPARVGLGEKVANVLSTVETAQSLGVPLPDVDKIPVVGPVISGYLKLRAISGALKGARVRATPTTRAAGAVNDVRARITDNVTRVARAGTRAIAAPRAASIASRVSSHVGNRPVVEWAAESSRAAREGVEQELRDLRLELAGAPAGVVAAAEGALARKQSYIESNAPRPPAAGTAFEPAGWKPSPAAAREWARVDLALKHPLDALGALSAGDQDPAVLAAIRAVYPALLAQQRAEIAASIDELSNLPRGQRIRIGRNFGVPLDFSQLPVYGHAPDLATQTQPGVGPDGIRTAAPSSTGVASDLALTADDRRLAR